MKITILPQGTLAIYEQIVNQLKNAVVTGELKAGEALPSIRALAADLGVSVITTKRAYEELEKEGLVRSVAGKGFYVCEYNADYLKEKQLVLLEKRLNEVIEEAKQAGLAKEDFVEMVQALENVCAVGAGGIRYLRFIRLWRIQKKRRKRAWKKKYCGLNR